MRTLGKNDIWSYYDDVAYARRIQTATTARGGSGHPVKSFLELATKVAELQFRNPDLVLMFRGQNADHLSLKGNTLLKPSLFRPKGGDRNGPSLDELTKRYTDLERAEKHLVEEYRREKILGRGRLERHRMLRWAILQHYGVCPTPLLDVTHSLRIAASFASHKSGTNAFLFVLGIPNVSGAITASADAGLQIIRLSSVCPPAAVRPHIQEGYLLGEYPDMVNCDQKELYAQYEMDFGRRLVAKFRFDPGHFWKERTFPRVAHSALYPSKGKDPLCELTFRVKKLANC